MVILLFQKKKKNLDGIIKTLNLSKDDKFYK